MMLYQLALAVMDSRSNTLLICLDHVRDSKIIRWISNNMGSKSK